MITFILVFAREIKLSMFRRNLMAVITTKNHVMTRNRVFYGLLHGHVKENKNLRLNLQSKSKLKTQVISMLI